MKLLFRFVFLIFTTVVLFGSGENFQQLTSEQGLPHNNVYSIIQDQSGYIWIGTQDGVTKYDGYHFQTFQHNPLNKNSLTESNFGKIIETPDGILWFGTYGGGLNRYDPKTGTFRSFKHHSDNPTSISGNFIISMFYHKGKIWIATTTHGVNCFDPVKESFQHFRHEGGGLLSSDKIRTILMDKNDVLWIGTHGSGLDRLNIQTKTVRNFRFDPDNAQTISHDIVTSLCMGPHEHLWIGTRGGGLNRFNTTTGKTIRFIPEPEKEHSLSDLFINNLLFDHYGHLWIGTYSKGLNRLDPETGIFRNYLHDPNNISSLGQNRVESLFEDQSSVLWVGTKGAGISMLDLKPQKFHHHRPENDNQRIISNNISTISEDKEGAIWVGTDGGGINRITKDDDFQVFLPKNQSLGQRRVWSINIDSKERFWAGTYTGLKRFNKETGVFTQVKLQIPESNLLESGIINHIIEDHEGDIWVASSNGLFRISDQGSQLSGKYYAINSGNAKNYVSTLLEDRSHRIWLGTDYGLVQLAPKTGLMKTFDHQSNDSRTISHNRIESLFEDSHGSLWIGTASGLNRYREEDQSFIHFFVSSGLPNNNIRGILEDKDGFLWISTNGGISQFNPTKKTFRNFDTRDGLPSNDYNFGSCIQAVDGTLYFGGSMGLVSFNPRAVYDNPHKPPVVLTSFTVNGEPVDFATYVNADRIMELPHTQDSISFEFAALDFTQSKENLYAYKLEPYDKDWIQCGTRNFGQYTNISPGTYTLRIKGSNNDQVWNEKGLSLKLTVFPPMWATLWFRTLSALALLFIGWTFYQYRTHQMRQYNTQLQDINAHLKNEISEREVAEEKLEYSKNHLSNIINSLSSLVIAVDNNTMITQWNTAATLYTGISPDHAITRPLFKVLPFLLQYRKAMDEVKETHAPVEYLKENININNGICVNLSIFPLVFKDMVGQVICMDDVTELERKETQLRQAQKMETVGNLAGGLAHDFNNVLGGIMGTASILKFFFDSEKSISKEKIYKHITTIESSATRAANIVKRLLSISKKQKLNFLPTDLNLALRNVIILCRNTFEKSIQIKTSYFESDAMVYADPAQLEQVLLNLCMNAAHAMTLMRPETTRQGGEMHASIALLHANPGFRVRYPEANEIGYWKLTITDTGVGMDPITLSQIFDPFFTTKEKDSGSGLGLSMVYNIIEQHKGFIDVLSEPGIGTTFQIFLPNLSSEDQASTSEVEHKLHYDNGLILIVDDETVIRQTAREILELCGYEVIEARDGVEGVQVFREQHREIKAVLLDMVMPNASGKEAYMEMKAIDPDLKVLLTSGFKQDERVQRLLAMGIQDFIQKPFTLENLSHSFHELLKS